MSKDLIIRSSSAKFIIFEKQKNHKGIEVRFNDGHLWLNQKIISKLFNTTINNITMYVASIYEILDLNVLDKGGIHHGVMD